MSMMCRPKWQFLHMYRSHDMRHVDFHGLTGSQRTPRVWGVTAFIYAISDSPWVSPVHVVPKKGGFTVIRNERNELILTRTAT